MLASQIYKLHGFIPNQYKIYYFMDSYCLNTNVMHYLNMEVVCMTLCLNNTNKHITSMYKQYEHAYDIRV